MKRYCCIPSSSASSVVISLVPPFIWNRLNQAVGAYILDRFLLFNDTLALLTTDKATNRTILQSFIPAQRHLTACVYSEFRMCKFLTQYKKLVSLSIDYGPMAKFPTHMEGSNDLDSNSGSLTAINISFGGKLVHWDLIDYSEQETFIGNIVTLIKMASRCHKLQSFRYKEGIFNLWTNEHEGDALINLFQQCPNVNSLGLMLRPYCEPDYDTAPVPVPDPYYVESTVEFAKILQNLTHAGKHTITDLYIQGDTWDKHEYKLDFGSQLHSLSFFKPLADFKEKERFDLAWPSITSVIAPALEILRMPEMLKGVNFPALRVLEVFLVPDVMDLKAFHFLQSFTCYGRVTPDCFAKIVSNLPLLNNIVLMNKSYVGNYVENYVENFIVPGRLVDRLVIHDIPYDNPKYIVCMLKISNCRVLELLNIRPDTLFSILKLIAQHLANIQKLTIDKVMDIHHDELIDDKHNDDDIMLPMLELLHLPLTNASQYILDNLVCPALKELHITELHITHRPSYSSKYLTLDKALDLNCFMARSGKDCQVLSMIVPIVFQPKAVLPWRKASLVLTHGNDNYLFLQSLCPNLETLELELRGQDCVVQDCIPVGIKSLKIAHRGNCHNGYSFGKDTAMWWVKFLLLFPRLESCYFEFKCNWCYYKKEKCEPLVSNNDWQPIVKVIKNTPALNQLKVVDLSLLNPLIRSRYY